MVSLLGEDLLHGQRVRITAYARRAINVERAVEPAMKREGHEVREGPRDVTGNLFDGVVIASLEHERVVLLCQLACSRYSRDFCQQP